jgi:hypothetical protein
MAHTQKPDFVFQRNGRVHLNQRGRQFSRLLAAEVCASAVVMLDTPCSEVVWRVLATHSIHLFPLYFRSRASPCAITFQLSSTKSTWQKFASGLKHKAALKVSSHQKMTTPALCLVLMCLSPVRATPISSWQLSPWHRLSCRASEDGQPLQYLLVKYWPTLASCTLPLSAIMLWTRHLTVLICFTIRLCSDRPHNTPIFLIV